MKKNKKNLSIIIPAYNEEKNVSFLVEKIIKVMGKIRKTYEIVFVNDGSTDNTLKEILELKKKNKNIRVISHRRNYGKAMALQTGFDNAEGEIIITMDADLQDDPEEIPKFLERLKYRDLVVGWKYNKHKNDPWKRFVNKVFNSLTRKFTKVKLHDFNCPFKAMKKEVAKNINVYGELHRYVPVLASWKGFSVGEIPIKNFPRKFGKTKYSKFSFIKGFYDLLTVKFLTRFSSRPLHFFGSLGFISSFIGFVICLVLSIRKIIGYGITENLPLLLLGILLIVIGIQFVSLGFLGEMTAREKREKPIIE